LDSGNQKLALKKLRARLFVSEMIGRLQNMTVSAITHLFDMPFLNGHQSVFGI
jgi:hypothetical protein